MLSALDDEWFQIIILFLVSAQCLPSSLEQRITKHYPDSQVISQQELRIRIWCSLSANIAEMFVLTILTVLQFCRLRYKMLVRPINLSLWYCVKDNVVLQALCPSSNCLYTNSQFTMLPPLRCEVGYELSTSKWSNSTQALLAFYHRIGLIPWWFF